MPASSVIRQYQVQSCCTYQHTLNFKALGLLPEPCMQTHQLKALPHRAGAGATSDPGHAEYHAMWSSQGHLQRGATLADTGASSRTREATAAVAAHRTRAEPHRVDQQWLELARGCSKPELCGVPCAALHVRAILCVERAGERSTKLLGTTPFHYVHNCASEERLVVHLRKSESRSSCWPRRKLTRSPPLAPSPPPSRRFNSPASQPRRQRAQQAPGQRSVRSRWWTPVNDAGPSAAMPQIGNEKEGAGARRILMYCRKRSGGLCRH